MSEVTIRAALQTRLGTMAPAIHTVHENETYKPIADTPYQKVNMLRGQPANPEQGAMRQAVGIFQVTLFYPPNAATGAAEARADAIAAHFARPLSLTLSGIVVTIDRSPYVMPGFQDGGRWAVPVRISYFANLF